MDLENIQEKRKLDHLKGFMELDFHGENGFDEFFLKPTLFPELSLSEISTEAELFGRMFPFPLMIEAITGGMPEGDRINGVLCELASQFNLPMAVGSQSIAVKYPAREAGFRRLREINPEGFLFANVGADISLDGVSRAIDMLRADGVQLHINTAQELAMAEGDRDFRGIFENIIRIAENIKLPVILKETGFGMDFDGVMKTFSTGVSGVDVGGSGGTDFAKIENWRRGRTDGFLEGWGNTTYESVRNAVKARMCLVEKNQNQGIAETRPSKYIIASGGMGKAMDGVKAMGMGADFIGVAGSLLREVMNSGGKSGEKWIQSYMEDFKKIMVLTGKRNLI